MSKRHFEFGKLIGGVESELNCSTIRALEGYTEVMDSPEAEPLKRNMCKLAALAFEVDGAEKSAHAILFRNLADAPKWYPEFNRFTDCVTRALAKQATTLVPAAAVAANDKLGGLAAKLLALGTIGGIGAGGLGFLMARDSRQTSAENAALIEKIRAYRQLRRDLEEDMSSDQVLSDATNSKPQRYDV
jgi:hypothetical protein